jgi:hypothetical protein
MRRRTFYICLFAAVLLTGAAAFWYLSKEKSGHAVPIAVNPYFPMPKFEEVQTIDLEKESARFADFFNPVSTAPVAPDTSMFHN